MVEVAGRSDAGRVSRSWEASSARTKMAEVPLKLAQRTSANQARWRDLLMRSFKLRSDKRQYLLNGPTVWVVDRGSNKGLCSSTVGQYTPRKDDVPFEARLFR
jgi:predicted phosphoribosyltransferase